MPSAASAKSQLWEAGVAAAWYLRDDQLPAYRFMRAHRFPVYEAARRFGKTTIELTIAQEDLRQNAGWIWRWCEPWKYQAREIVMPEMEKIEYTCPSRLRSKFYKTDSFYEFRNGSRLYLRGVNEDKGESARGSFAHRITADEKGSWKDADYIENEVLIPQLLTTNGALHSLSTPPRDLGHRWYKDKDKAVRDGRFLQNIIHDNESLTPEQIRELCEAMGGEKSTAWQREFLCMAVADPEMQIVPEYSEHNNDLADDHPRPDFYDLYVGGDGGVDDNTFLVFGYYDFINDWVVIEDELVMNNQTTQAIVEAAKAKEEILWGRTKPFSRVYDADKQVLVDMIGTHRYNVVLPRKEDKHAAIREFRVRVGSGRFKVKKRCKVLRHQLRVGMWSNDKHVDFERSAEPELRHLDGIAAAVYFNRSIITSRNPYPQNVGVSPFTHLIPDNPSSMTPDESVISALFRRP